MAKKKHAQTTYCFPDGLQAQLAKIADHTLTVVEAPSGFGKTTAVREYLKGKGHRLGTARWYTCLGEAPGRAWAGMCALFAGLHAGGGLLPDHQNSLAETLQGLGPPTAKTLPDITALLQESRCNKPLCLVIDNYQLFEHDVPRKFLAALSACTIPNLHLVVITQPLAGEAETTHQPHHRISTQDFLFDTIDITAYCRLCDLDISRQQAEHIQGSSGGWIAAIRLQIKNYVETGQLMDVQGINHLLDIAVWNRLCEAERHCLLTLALLDGFTTQQAAIAGGEAAMPKNLEQLLALEFFIRYVTDKQVYVIHSILQNYLLERLAMQPQAVTDALRRRAAAACLAKKDYYRAARLFERVGDYDAVLSLPLSLQYFYNHKEADIISFFQRFVDECPEATLRNYPVFLVLIAYQFMRSSMPLAFQRAIGLIQSAIADGQNLPHETLTRVQGEFSILMSFTQFNDIAKMSTYHRKAFAFLKSISKHPRSMVFQSSTHWILGSTSVVSVYWNKTGGLDNALVAMRESLPFYTELTGGHAAGGEVLMQAEVDLACGKDDAAETNCYKAHYLSEKAGQTGNSICAELVLAQIALLRGDTKAYSASRLRIEEAMIQGRQTDLIRLGEMGLAQLDMSMGKADNLPEWLYSPHVIRRIFYNLSQPHAMMLHGYCLLLEKRHAELYGLTDPIMELAQRMNYMLPQLCHLLCLTVANHRDGKDDQAAAHLRQALAIALPDRVYLPFAEHAQTILPLLESLQTDDDSRMAECLALCRRWLAGTATVQRTLFAGSQPLTPRESEVARLAKERMSVDEMAASLRISPNTVKTLLRGVYRKLGVKGKAQLKEVRG